jgi:hypothetical protein
MHMDEVASLVQGGEVMQRLERYPLVKARIAKLLDLIENTSSDLCLADAAEQRAIDELRALGQELLQGWGQRLADEEAARMGKDAAVVRQVKKTPLAQHVRRNHSR